MIYVDKKWKIQEKLKNTKTSTEKIFNNIAKNKGNTKENVIPSVYMYSISCEGNGRAIGKNSRTEKKSN